MMTSDEIGETQNANNANQKVVEKSFNQNGNIRLEDELMTSQALNTQIKTCEKSAEEILNETVNRLPDFHSDELNTQISNCTSDQLIGKIFHENELPELMAFEICDSEFELATSQVLNTEDNNKSDEKYVEEIFKENEIKLSERESPTSQVLNTLEETFKENEDKLSEREKLTSQVSNTKNINDQNEKSVGEMFHESEIATLVTSEISNSQHVDETQEQVVEETQEQVVEETQEQVVEETLNESGDKLTGISDTHEDAQTAAETDERLLDDTLNENEDAPPEFEFAGFLKATHKNKIYGVQFYNDLSQEPFIFATVGGNNVTIYECTQEEMRPLKTYIDPNENEIFYTCCWSQNPHTSKAILAFAGFHGILKVVYPTCMTPTQVHLGHGRPINHITVHPKDPSILLSASDDQTLRLWNIESGQCIAVFGGVDGHKDQVVHADFDSTGSRIISCGVDSSLKIWQLDRSPIKNVIERSFSEANNRPFKIHECHFPEFTTKDIHRGIVDCAKWHGNLILSKSTDNAIICWAPGSFTKSSSSVKVDYATEILRLDIDDCDYWFIRFSSDSAKKYLAIGNNVGETFVWLLDCDNPTKCTVLEHEECTATIRQTAFSPDGRMLICVCDDNTVFKWNMK